MATSGNHFSIEGAVAGADLTGHQYRWVKLNSADTSQIAVIPVAAVGEGIGILQNAPRAGEAANVAYLGVSKLVASGAIGVAGAVQSAADGKGVAGGSMATALSAATAADQIVTVVIK